VSCWDEQSVLGTTSRQRWRSLQEGGHVGVVWIDRSPVEEIETKRWEVGGGGRRGETHLVGLIVVKDVHHHRTMASQHQSGFINRHDPFRHSTPACQDVGDGISKLLTRIYIGIDSLNLISPTTFQLSDIGEKEHFSNPPKYQLPRTTPHACLKNTIAHTQLHSSVEHGDLICWSCLEGSCPNKISNSFKRIYSIGNI
jgi:hypothetical protein